MDLIKRTGNDIQQVYRYEIDQIVKVALSPRKERVSNAIPESNLPWRMRVTSRYLDRRHLPVYDLVFTDDVENGFIGVKEQDIKTLY